MTAPRQLVLAIDDDPGILKLLKLELDDQGFRVLTAATGAEGLRLADEQQPALILLDVGLPDTSGFEVLADLRTRSHVPVIMLTAKRSEVDKVHGFQLGADDYLGKPFSLDELSARARAILRRTAVPESAARVVSIEDLEIDLERRTVRRAGEIVWLSRTEWNLLQCLAANAGKVVPSRDLLVGVWGPEYGGDRQYLRVWISRLRARLERRPASPTVVRTFPGVGYMLNNGDGSAAESRADDRSANTRKHVHREGQQVTSPVVAIEELQPA